MHEMLADELLAYSPGVDEQGIPGILEIQDGQARAPAHEADIDEQDLEAPFVSLRAEGYAIGGAVPDLVGYARPQGVLGPA